jgi:CheY-like chemotaxis protein
MNIHDAVDILLVEDNPHDAEMTFRALHKYNIINTIVHVSDGEEALDFIFSRGKYSSRNPAAPKVILLDLKLPKIDGIEVLTAIKADESARLIPVVILTSSAEESTLVKAYALGANSYLVKPVEFGPFCEAIKNFGLYWLLLNRVVVP